MNVSTLSGNLQQLMRIHGNLSPSDLSRLTNIPQPTIHHILCGDTKKPRQKALAALAAFFSVSIEQLVGHMPLPHIIPQIIKEDLNLLTIPIIEWEGLKHWPHAIDNRGKELLLDRMIGENSFALISQSVATDAIFPPNTMLIFDGGRIPGDRDFIVARLKRNSSILLNRLFIEGSDYYLKQEASNGDVQLIKIIPHTDEILGVLIEARVQY